MGATRKLLCVHNVTLRRAWTLEPAEDAAEEAEGAALVGGGEVEATEDETEVVLVCGFHARR